jgi:hypothetical protein
VLTHSWERGFGPVSRQIPSATAMDDWEGQKQVIWGDNQFEQNYIQ